MHIQPKLKLASYSHQTFAENCGLEQRAVYLGKMKMLIFVYVVAIVHLGATKYYNHEYHVRPNQNFKEMIEHNLFPATNNTKVVLMSGIHEVINSTKEGLWLGNVYSYMFTGESGATGATTIISCKRNFSIVFYYCEDVIISDMTFEHCNLMFICTDDVTIARVRVIDSEFNYNAHSKFKHCYDYCGDRTTNITNAVFINSGVYIQLETCAGGIPSDHSSWLVIEHSVIENVSRKPALFIWHAETVIIANVTFRSNFNVKMFRTMHLNSILCIDRVHKVDLQNVTFFNNSSPVVLSMQVEYYHIRFKGHCSFISNTAEHTLMATTYFNISHSSIVFRNNYARRKILDVRYNSNQDLHYIIQNSEVLFANNTSEGPMMEIASIASLHTSSITFENNTSVNNHRFHTNSEEWSRTDLYCAILLISSSTVYVFNSQVQFFNNSAQYSGGITLVDGT